MRTDITYLENTSNGNTPLMLEMIDIFCEQVEETRKEMLDMLGQQEWVKLGKLAHKMKGTVSIVGMGKLANELKEFELLTVDNKEIENYEDYINHFIFETKEAEKELREIANNLG